MNIFQYFLEGILNSCHLPPDQTDPLDTQDVRVRGNIKVMSSPTDILIYGFRCIEFSFIVQDRPQKICVPLKWQNAKEVIIPYKNIDDLGSY